MGDMFVNSEWFAYSAALGGALWGVTMQPDFKVISLGTKAWRFFLSVIAAIFTGPFLLHMWLQDAHPSAAGFCLFIVSMVSLAVGPVLIQRVTTWAKQVRVSISTRNDQ